MSTSPASPIKGKVSKSYPSDAWTSEIKRTHLVRDIQNYAVLPGLEMMSGKHRTQKQLGNENLENPLDAAHSTIDLAMQLTEGKMAKRMERTAMSVWVEFEDTRPSLKDSWPMTKAFG